MLFNFLTEEDGYYEDLYPGPVRGTYSDDLLGVVVDHASDGEETSEVMHLSIISQENCEGRQREWPGLKMANKSQLLKKINRVLRHRDLKLDT